MKVKVKPKLVLVSVIIDSMLVILINCSSRTLKCILSKYFSFLIDFWLKENKLTKIKMLHLGKLPKKFLGDLSQMWVGVVADS